MVGWVAIHLECSGRSLYGPLNRVLRKVLHAHAVIAATRIPTLVSIRLKGHNDWTVLAMPIPNKGHCVKRLMLVLGTFIFY